MLEAPPSLASLLQRAGHHDPTGFLPAIDASVQSFFSRAQTLNPTFPSELHARFVEKILPEAPAAHASDIAHLRERFSNLVAIDGSRLHKISHRVKIVQDEKAAILPGALLAVYDIASGILSQLWFHSDAASGELSRALLAVECLKPGTLVVADRLYSSPGFFRALEKQGANGVVRRSKALKTRSLKCLERWQVAGELLDALLVEVFRGENRMILRLIRLQRNAKTYDAHTNVLKRKKLSAADAALLYPYRWQVERLFFDLKVVLNLKRFYCAKPNALVQ